MLTTSPRCRDYVKGIEQLRLVAYRCPAGVWTIGYGATGRGIGPGVRWSKAQAEERFNRDMGDVEAGVRSLLKGGATSQGQFDALCSFAFNCGLDIDEDTNAEGLGDSTLLKRHLAGDYAGAAAEFGRWNRAGGRILNGLTARRATEAAWYRGA